MIGNKFRPWGELSWLLSKLPKIKWDLISCLSTEDRYIKTLKELEKIEQVNKCLFYKLIDPPSNDSSEISSILNQNEKALKAATQATLEVEEHYLLEPYKNIVDSTNRFLNTSSGNIIVDITTFPKRFFFPIVKLLINQKLNNLIITYSTAKTYCDELSGNPNPWDHLPLFSSVEFPEPKPNVAIVGVGFMPFGLADLLSSTYNATPIRFLLPFPPGPPNDQRTWEFMHIIEKSSPVKTTDSIIRLDSNNMPDAFDFIHKETNGGNKNAIFAPYGPKPMSLAMCIYATLAGSPVYYTQPMYYNPKYSTGDNDCFAYCITLNKKLLYSL